jgi:hypothetical protein
MRNAYRIVDGKNEGKKPSEDSHVDWTTILKCTFEKPDG